jgi:hypothetical protein
MPFMGIDFYFYFYMNIIRWIGEHEWQARWKILNFGWKMDDWHMDTWRINDECYRNEKHGCKNLWTNGKFDETPINVWWISNEWTPWMNWWIDVIMGWKVDEIKMKKWCQYANS